MAILNADLVIYGRSARLQGRHPLSVDLATKHTPDNGWVMLGADGVNCIRYGDGYPATFSDPGMIRRILVDLMGRTAS